MARYVSFFLLTPLLCYWYWYWYCLFPVDIKNKKTLIVVW